MALTTLLVKTIVFYVTHLFPFSFHSLILLIHIYCRKVLDRPRDPAKWNEIADVVSALSIPVIANGDVFDYEDIQRIKVATGFKNLFIVRLFGSKFNEVGDI